MSSASFRTRELMEDYWPQATALKVESVRTAGATEIDDCAFDLVIAHLRVPELV